MKLYPPQAVKAAVRTGQAKVVCTVSHEGYLTDCAVVEERPANLGFGDAALQVAAAMQMNPWTSQGSPVDGGRIELPIKMVLPEEPAPAPRAPAPPAKP